MIFALLLACAPSPPGVLVIVQDTTRADFGGAGDLELPGDWRIYENAYSAAPYTTAATATIASGLYPVGDERLLPGGGPPPCGEDQRPPQRPAWPADAWPDMVLTDQPVVAMMSPLARMVGPRRQSGPGSAALFAQAATYIDGYRAVLVHSKGAHDPYDGEKDKELSAEAAAYRTASWCGQEPTLEIATWAVDAYQKAVVASREGLAELVGAALAQGFVVVITSDHGESLGEEGLWGHSTSLGNPQTWVPLRVAGPGVVPGTDDRVVPATCVGQTARAILDGYPPPGACDLRTGNGLDGLGAVSGMLLADGVWDERVILSPALAVAP